MTDLEQPELLPLRPALAPPNNGVRQTYSGISASDHARQQNGNIYNSNAGHSASGEARQYMGDVTNNTTYNYSVRKRKSDDTLREDGRNRAFLSASAEGQTPRVRHLMRLGVDLDYSDDDGFNALHHACLSGFEDVVQLLLDAGVDINAQSLDLGTPLCLAVLRERERVVKLLLSSRADVNKAGQWIGSPLHCAAHVGSLSIAEMLLDYGAHRATSCAVQNEYFSFSCSSNSPATFAKAPKDSKGLHIIWDCQPLIIAASRGHESLVDRLLKAGCAVDDESRGWSTANPTTQSFESQQDPGLKCSGQTALMQACQSEESRIVSQLIEAGAMVDKAGSDGRTALHISAHHGHLDCAQTLVEAGATVDLVDRYLQTPLHLTAYRGHAPVVEYLLQQGADVGAQKDQNSTACHLAVEQGHLNVIEVLLAHGADVSKRDVYDRTPLHISSSAAITKLLLDGGANPADQDKDGFTALHFAASYKDVDVVKVLLEHGADASVKDISGRTARDYVSEKNSELYKLLSTAANDTRGAGTFKIGAGSNGSKGRANPENTLPLPDTLLQASRAGQTNTGTGNQGSPVRQAQEKPQSNSESSKESNEIIKRANVLFRNEIPSLSLHSPALIKGYVILTKHRLEILQRASSGNRSRAKLGLDELSEFRLKPGELQFWSFRDAGSVWTLRFGTSTERDEWCYLLRQRH